MNKMNRFFCAALACGLTQGFVLAQGVAPVGSENPNRFGLSYRMGYNMPVTFKNLGGYAPLDPMSNPRNPLQTPDGIRYNYDNGYIYSDDYQDVHPGVTWNYGYVEGTPQRPGAAPTQFDLFRSSSPGDLVSRDNADDPQNGMEMTYARKLGRAGKGFWGVEAAVGWMRLNVSDDRALYGDVNRSATTFQTGGGAVLPPTVQGSAGGPSDNDLTGWPLVQLNSVGGSSQAFEGAALVTGERDFSARFVSFRFGPYLELPMTERLTYTMSAGVAFNWIRSEFSFTENVLLDPAVTLVPLPAAQYASSSTEDDFVVGGYVGGTFSYAINERWRLFAGAQLQFSEQYEHREGNRMAVMDLGKAIMVSLGGTISF